jgi:protocatechuate 3,4-dioxygenase beta subunit
VFVGTVLSLRLERPGEVFVVVERKIDTEPTVIAVQLPSTELTLSGTVRDATGHPIAGAAVSVANEETNQSGSVLTGSDGSYEFKLAEGHYELRANATTIGEAYADIEKLHLTADQAEDFTMLASRRAILRVTDSKGDPVSGVVAETPGNASVNTSGETSQGTPVQYGGQISQGTCETNSEGECTIQVFVGTVLSLRLERPGEVFVVVERKIDTEPTVIAVQLPSDNEPPEFGRCQKGKKGTGKYDDSACTTSGGRDLYEWSPGAISALFAVSGAKVKFETVTKASLVCAGVTGAGEFVGTKRLKAVTLILTNCKSAGKTCSSSGAVLGEVRSYPLVGELQWENRATRSVLLDLSRVGGPLFSLDCAGISIDITGSILVPVKADKMSLKQTLRYKAKKGVQATTEYETTSGTRVVGTLRMSLNGGPPVQTGLTTNIVLSSQEQLEISSFL